jgi:hypothetical protein
MDYYQRRNEIRKIMQDMEFGREVVALFGVLNNSKSLSSEQIALLSATYAPIQNLLLSGAINTARLAIEQVVPDGVVITQEDKDEIVTYLRDYLGM